MNAKTSKYLRHLAEKYAPKPDEIDGLYKHLKGIYLNTPRPARTLVKTVLENSLKLRKENTIHGSNS
jgi:hypothetical protein